MLLYQPLNGYCYNSDTHFLFNFVCENLKQFKNIQGDILDIGCGCGVLGLLLKRDYNKLKLNQCEIQEDFIFLSQKNAKINNIKSNIFKGDFLKLDFDKKFDFIVSNPPFYPKENKQTKNINKKIARYNDNLPLKEFLQKVTKLLNSNGKFFFCYDIKLLNDIIIYCNQFGLNIESLQFLYPKFNKPSSLVLVMCRVNSKTNCKVLPPIVMFDDDDSFSKITNKVYEKCSTYSIKCEI
jgi:tRNA1(Val) A37 N6-methylase TrmN6